MYFPVSLKGFFTMDKQESSVSNTVMGDEFVKILNDKIALTGGGAENGADLPSIRNGSMHVGNTASMREEAIYRARGQEAIKWMARRFGMPAGFFNVILDKLGIRAEDLGNPETCGAALGAIADYFGLSEEEKEDFLEDFSGYMESIGINMIS